jgi:predicted nucleic acid-binding protein
VRSGLSLGTQATHAWIVDTSPFIGLAKLGLLDLLNGTRREVIITDAVRREVLSGSAYDAAQAAMDGAWGLVTSSVFVPPHLAALNLGAGETSVLAEALRREGSIAIIDELAGRAAARTLGLAVVGTTGVLVRARQEGRLPAVAPELMRLRAAGLYLPSDALLTPLLEKLGEAWP